MSYYMNDPLSIDTIRQLRQLFSFSDDITAVDLNCQEGHNLYHLTRAAKNAYLYGASEHRNPSKIIEMFSYQKCCKASYRSTSKITNDAFSLALCNPVIANGLMNDLFYKVDPFLIPDFEKEERAKHQAELANQLLLDFDELLDSADEIKKRKEAMEETIKKAVEERKKTFDRMLREQDKRYENMRSDLFYLNLMTKFLKLHGILVFVIPKEFLDQKICTRLVNSYDQIRIFRPEMDEYQDQRKIIVVARKRKTISEDPEKIKQLMRYRVMPIKDIDPLPTSANVDFFYTVPSCKNEEVQLFRLGPITEEEALATLSKSPAIEKMMQMSLTQIVNEIPTPPTQLRKGHVSLCLASGMLNGYIGSGPDQHLVKGSVIKCVGDLQEEEDPETGEVTTKENEYFSIGIKYLDRHGMFHKLL